MSQWRVRTRTEDRTARGWPCRLALSKDPLRLLEELRGETLKDLGVLLIADGNTAREMLGFYYSAQQPSATALALVHANIIDTMLKNCR